MTPREIGTQSRNTQTRPSGGSEGSGKALLGWGPENAGSSRGKKGRKNQHDKDLKGRENTFVFLGMWVFSHGAYLKGHVQITTNFIKAPGTLATV